jgi:hypothetical protein
VFRLTLKWVKRFETEAIFDHPREKLFSKFEIDVLVKGMKA